MAYGLLPAGFVLPDFNTIISEIQQDFIIKYNAAGITIDTSKDPFKQLIAVVAEREYEIWLMMKSVFDSSNPDNASGQVLSMQVALNGMRRMGPTYSVVNVVVQAEAAIGFNVQIGDIISDENTGQLWESTVAQAVLAGDSFTAAYQCVDPGAITASAGVLNVIQTPKAGWLSAVNPADATQGQPYESDSELKLRRDQLIRARSIQNRLLNEVDGVTYATVYQNDTGAVDAQGRPANSVEAVVTVG